MLGSRLSSSFAELQDRGHVATAITLAFVFVSRALAQYNDEDLKSH